MANTTGTNTLDSTLNIKNLINYNGYYVISGATLRRTLPLFVNNDNTYGINFGTNESDGNLYETHFDSSLNGSSITMVIEYTKTTD